jgi:hypothetical protein
LAGPSEKRVSKVSQEKLTALLLQMTRSLPSAEVVATGDESASALAFAISCCQLCVEVLRGGDNPCSLITHDQTDSQRDHARAGAMPFGTFDRA